VHGKMNSNLRERVKDTILERASGIFLIAYFAWTTFSELKNADCTPAAIKSLIKKVSSLGSTLRKAYKSIIRRLDIRNQTSVMKLLR